jgi:hypothetical protein
MVWSYHELSVFPDFLSCTQASRLHVLASINFGQMRVEIVMSAAQSLYAFSTRTFKHKCIIYLTLLAHSGGPWCTSRPGDRLSWLRSSLGFLSPSRQMPGYLRIRPWPLPYKSFPTYQSLNTLSFDAQYLFIYLFIIFTIYNSDYIASYERVISAWWIGKDLEGSGRCLILRSYAGIRQEWLRITTKTCHDSRPRARDLNPRPPPQYKAGVVGLTTRPPRSVWTLQLN